MKNETMGERLARLLMRLPCLLGHDFVGGTFGFERARLTACCRRCGAPSSGWNVDGRPVLRYAGDARRHVLRVGPVRRIDSPIAQAVRSMAGEPPIDSILVACFPEANAEWRGNRKVQ